MKLLFAILLFTYSSIFFKHGIQGTEYFVLKIKFVLMYHDLIYLLSGFSEVHFGKARPFQTFLLWTWFQPGWDINECIFSWFFISRTYNFRNYFAYWKAWLFLCHQIFITLDEIIKFIMSLGISNSIKNTFSHLFVSERKQCKDSLMNLEKVVLC